MADIQEWFIANQVRNFYSVSISGYHIAEAGANRSASCLHPGQRVHYVESYLAGACRFDDFAPKPVVLLLQCMDPESP